MDATLSDEWINTIDSIDYTGFTFSLDFYQTVPFAQAKVEFFIGDGANTKSISLSVQDQNAFFHFDILETVMSEDGGTTNMAAITKSRQTAVTVNCVESSCDDAPSDIYGIISDSAFDNTKEETQTLILKYGRKMSKNPVMITGYGAGEDTVIANIAKFLAEHHEDAAKATDIGEAYIAAIEDNAGAVKSLTEALKGKLKGLWNTGQLASIDYSGRL